MNEKLSALWGKIVDHKEIVIRVGCAIVGAAVGSVITAAVINAQADSYLLEEMTTSVEEVA